MEHSVFAYLENKFEQKSGAINGKAVTSVTVILTGC
jgi:hypothetical protein